MLASFVSARIACCEDAKPSSPPSPGLPPEVDDALRRRPECRVSTERVARIMLNGGPATRDETKRWFLLCPHEPRTLLLERRSTAPLDDAGAGAGAGAGGGVVAAPLIPFFGADGEDDDFLRGFGAFPTLPEALRRIIGEAAERERGERGERGGHGERGERGGRGGCGDREDSSDRAAITERARGLRV